MSDGRAIHLEFICAECKQTIILKNEEELFDMMDSQVIGEKRMLHCRECIEKLS
jgi:DNA-directed RNA polymerase subunit RPC12/RpoP